MHHGNESMNKQIKEMMAQKVQDRMAEKVKLMEEEAKKLELGATGNYPNGKLVNHDEGEIKIAVTNYQGNVIVNFGKPVAFIGFTAKQAIDIAYLIIEKAQETEREQLA